MFTGTVSDLLEMLLSATDVESGAKLSQKQLQDLVMAFMLAGHEVSSSVMMTGYCSIYHDGGCGRRN